MYLPLIKLPHAFEKRNNIKSLSNTDISPNALSIISLAKNEQLISKKLFNAITLDNLQTTYEKCLSELTQFVKKFNTPNVSLELCKKRGRDNIDMDHVPLNSYFNILIDQCFELNFSLQRCSGNSGRKKASSKMQSCVSMIAIKATQILPSFSSISLIESSFDQELFDDFLLFCNKEKIPACAKNLIKFDSDSYCSENEEQANIFLKNMRWYADANPCISFKEINQSINEITCLEEQKILKKITKQLKKLHTSHNAYCKSNLFGFREESLLLDSGIAIYGDFPDEDIHIQHEFEMQMQTGECIGEVFNPNHKKGLYHALTFFKQLQEFEKSVNNTFSPYQ